MHFLSIMQSLTCGANIYATFLDSLGPTPAGAKMAGGANRQWADVDSDDESEIKKARSLRNPVNLAGATGPETSTGESQIFEEIRMRASHADNTVSDGRYGRDQDERESSPRGNIRQEDSGPNFPRGQQFPNRDDYSVSDCSALWLLAYHRHYCTSIYIKRSSLIYVRLLTDISFLLLFS